MWNCQLITAILLGVVGISQAQYYGKLIGSFTQRGTTSSEHHDVAGDVYAIDENRLQIIGFTYDGMAPDAFIMIGTTASPDGTGVIVPKSQDQGSEKLSAYSNQNLVVQLDNSASISGYTWISIWCRTAQVNFADVYIPTNFVAPSEYSLGALGFNPPVHGVTATRVVVLNSKQIRFESLNYDGFGPDAYFWVDVRTPPTTSGTRVPQVGESSASKLNQRLTGATKTVQLPGDMTVFDIRNIGLWCVAARQNFGHVSIPQTLFQDQSIIPFSFAENTETFDNCEVLLDDEFQVSWVIEGSAITIRLSSRQQRGNYMSFGPSGSDTTTDMIGSDVVVAWIDQQTTMAKVVDYYLSSRQQCVRSTGVGVCPDTVTDPSGSNDVTLSGYKDQDGITHITYTRPLSATDSQDRAISAAGPIYVSWALGPINADDLATYHTDRTQGDVQIDFSRPRSSCPAFMGTTGDENDDAFVVPPIEALTATTFTCDIGDTGGVKGYQGITGAVGWGISWYINGDLIPEITLRRNVTYTFEVFGGNDVNQSASYHPFYITNDAAGGYAQLTDEEREGHVTYAGPVNGSSCFYHETSSTPPRDSLGSYESYRSTLERRCVEDPAVPGRLTWTPNEDTPDTVYYQCYTHRYLGWKIHVTDDANVCTLSLVVMVTSLLAAIFIK